MSSFCREAPCRLLSQPGWFCRSSLPLPELGGWAQSPFPGGFANLGCPVWPHLISGAVPRPLLSQHSVASIFQCASTPGWGQEINSLCTPLIKLLRYTNWEHIMPTNRPPVGKEVTHALGPCTACLNSSFVKSVSGHCCCSSEPLPGFPYTPTLWQVKSISQSLPVMVLHFPQLYVQTEYCSLSGTVPVSDCYPS